MAGGRVSTKFLYLRTIRRLSAGGTRVRNTDLARELGYSRPSITGAVKRLKEDGLITDDKTNGICLTPEGKAAADRSEDRSRILSGYFRSLGVEELSATENAGRIEHLISDDLFDAISKNV